MNPLTFAKNWLLGARPERARGDSARPCESVLGAFQGGVGGLTNVRLPRGQMSPPGWDASSFELAPATRSSPITGTLAGLQPQDVPLVPLGPDFENTASWRELPHDGAFLTSMRTQAWSALGISAFPPTEEKEGELLRTLMQRQAAGEPMPELERAFRLQWSEGRTSFVVDPQTNRVMLREHLAPRPPGLEPPDPSAEKFLLQNFVKETPSEGVNEYARAAASWLPPQVLDLVSRTKVRIELLARGSSSSYLKRFFGRFYDPEQMPDRNAVGAFSRGAKYIGYITGVKQSAYKTGEVVAHELMHDIDFALGKDGKALSEMPEFGEIYDRVMASTEGLRFPPRYPKSTRQEMFSYLATLMLRPCATWEGDVWTRADLLKLDDGKAYAYFQKVFGQLVPAALQTGQIQTAESALAAMNEQRRQLLSQPRSFLRLLFLRPKAWTEYARLRVRMFFLSLKESDYRLAHMVYAVARYARFFSVRSPDNEPVTFDAIASEVRHFPEEFTRGEASKAA